MDLQNYLRALRRRWWVVVLVVLLGAGLGMLKTVLSTKVYAATMTFYVATPHSTIDNAFASSQFAQDSANTYALLLSSDRLARQVKDTAHIGLSAGDLSSEISGSAELNTVLVNAEIRDTDVVRLRRIADGVARQFPIMVSRLDDRAGNQQVALSVVSGPAVSPVPVSPRPALNIALGGGVGLLLGLLLAALLEVLDTSIRTVSELEEFAGVPVVGDIVHDSTAKYVHALVGGSAHTRRAEDFRQLRTNLEFIHTAQEARVIAVTSSVPGEGKSSTALNIALMAAERGLRVLLIDADLRRPQIAEFLGLEAAIGLTTALARRVSFADAVRTWGDIQVLPSGASPPNPAELLDSPAMREMLSRWRTEFDLIVLDTPPVLAVTDAVVCSGIVDGTVVVYRHGRTRRAHLASTMRALETVDARVLGTVLNARPRRRGHGYDYGAYVSYLGKGKRRRRRRGLFRRGRVQPAPQRSSKRQPSGGWRPPADKNGRGKSGSARASAKRTDTRNGGERTGDPAARRTTQQSGRRRG